MMNLKTLALALLFVPLHSFAKVQEVKIQLNWKPEPQFGGFYAASLARSDQEQNLKFKLQAGGSGTPTVQMLRSGRADFAIVSADELILSNARNPKQQLVAVFASFQKNPQIIMCRSENRFSSLKEVFQSRVTLAWQEGLPYARFLKAQYPKTKVRSVPTGAGLAAFAKNSKMCQQGFITSEPFLATKLGVATNSFLIADEGFNPYTTVLAVRRDFLDKESDLVKRVVLATRAGWLSYLENPTATNAEMTRLNRAMDLRTMRESAEAQASLIRPSKKDLRVGEMEASRWRTLMGQMKETGLIKKDLDPNAQFSNF